MAAEVTGDAGIIEDFLCGGKVVSGGERVSFNIIIPVEHFVFFPSEMMKGKDVYFVFSYFFEE